jgi:hypothetical protein
MPNGDPKETNMLNMYKWICTCNEWREDKYLSQVILTKWVEFKRDSIIFRESAHQVEPQLFLLLQDKSE